MSKRGFLIFANNNPELDYGLVALINALMIKTNLKENHVTFVTDEHTLAYLKESRGQALLDKAFDNIIVQDWNEVKEAHTQRRFYDTKSTAKVLPWYNGSRKNAYDLSPYEETILIDCDYLVADKTLDLCWGSHEEIMINKDAITLEHKPPRITERYLNPYNISMYWATCVYFRKGDKAKLLFDLVAHVRENWEYYRFVYGFGGILYRNDFAFSIAIHMMNGFVSKDAIGSLPTPYLFTSFDSDELYDVPAKNEFLFYVNDTTEDWRFRLSRVKNTSVHVMNKFAVTRLADKFISHYGPVVEEEIR